MPDTTKDIEALLRQLSWNNDDPRFAEAVRALVAERDTLKHRVAELEPQEFPLPDEPFRDPDRDLRERLVCAALTGLCADANMNTRTYYIASVAANVADAVLAAMRKERGGA